MNPLDHDGDGFALPGDCDDNDPDIHPGAADAPYDGVDADCAGNSDNDADGVDAVAAGGTDCDDADPAVLPGATEACNGVDDDCDGEVDGAGAEGSLAFWVDADGDGFGGGDPTYYCDVQPDLVTTSGDCDDQDPDTWPSAPDIDCDGKDNDCLDNTFELGRITLDGVEVADLATAVADSVPGSEIEVCEGWYLTGDLVADHALTITGTNGALTILDGEGSVPVLTVATTDPVALSGLTLKQGLGANVGGVRRGGGLSVGPNGDVTGVDLHFELNVAGEGGAIYLGPGATLDLQSSSVDENTADPAATGTGVSFGGGIYAEDGVTLRLTDTSVDRNFASACGGIDLGGGGSIDGHGTSTVDDNAEGGLGGGGLCVSQGGAIADLEIARNTAYNAGGGLIGRDVELTGVVVTDNTTGLAGGGLSLTGSSTLTDCTVSSNLADIDGGGLDVDGDLVLIDSVIQSNEATYPWLGGGVRLFHGSLTSTDTDWGVGGTDNVASDVSLDGSGVVYSWAGVATFVCTDPEGTCL